MAPPSPTTHSGLFDTETEDCLSPAARSIFRSTSDRAREIVDLPRAKIDWATRNELVDDEDASRMTSTWPTLVIKSPAAVDRRAVAERWISSATIAAANAR